MLEFLGPYRSAGAEHTPHMHWNSAECEGGGGFVFQICDFWWELDRLLHDMYKGTQEKKGRHQRPAGADVTPEGDLCSEA